MEPERFFLKLLLSKYLITATERKFNGALASRRFFRHFIEAGGLWHHQASHPHRLGPSLSSSRKASPSRLATLGHRKPWTDFWQRQRSGQTRWCWFFEQERAWLPQDLHHVWVLKCPLVRGDPGSCSLQYAWPLALSERLPKTLWLSQLKNEPGPF